MSLNAEDLQAVVKQLEELTMASHATQEVCEALLKEIRPALRKLLAAKKEPEEDDVPEEVKETPKAPQKPTTTAPRKPRTTLFPTEE